MGAFAGKAAIVPSDANFYEDFEVGRRFQHHWGRTVTAGEAIAFSTQHLLHEPAGFNQAYAQHLGYPDVVVSSLFALSIVLGMSVEDLSESGGAFLGSDQVRFHRTIFSGDTLFASSSVVSRRASNSQPAYGVVEWETSGRNQRGELVISFRRTNLVRRREAGGAQSHA